MEKRYILHKLSCDSHPKFIFLWLCWKICLEHRVSLATISTLISAPQTNGSNSIINIQNVQQIAEFIDDTNSFSSQLQGTCYWFLKFFLVFCSHFYIFLWSYLWKKRPDQNFSDISSFLKVLPSGSRPNPLPDRSDSGSFHKLVYFLLIWLLSPSSLDIQVSSKWDNPYPWCSPIPWRPACLQALDLVIVMVCVRVCLYSKISIILSNRGGGKIGF